MRAGRAATLAVSMVAARQAVVASRAAVSMAVVEEAVVAGEAKQEKSVQSGV